VRQEENRCTERSYWLARSKKKREKKEEIDELLEALNI
jgi:hypothetical protein